MPDWCFGKGCDAACSVLTNIPDVNERPSLKNWEVERMPNRLEVYKCDICGNIVEVTHGGAGALVCCGEDMQLLKENTVDAAVEKHVPVIEMGNGVITVKVGSVAHPMEEAHFIEWIELLADGKLYRQYLKPGEAPQASFAITATAVTAREYCNLHGHWSAKA
jgi:superoxide reductase